MAGNDNAWMGALAPEEKLNEKFILKAL